MKRIDLTGYGIPEQVAHCVDAPDLAARVHAATNGAAIRLGIDAVAGAATARIASCLAEEATLCNYGAMTGEDPHMPRSELLFRGITLTGFVLGRFLGRRSLAEIQSIYADLGGQIKAGVLDAPIAKIYPIEDIHAALAHAQQGERGGKILVAPNGMI